MKSIQQDTKKMEAQLEQWGAKLDELVARAEAAGEDALSDGRKRVKELKAQHASARAKLEDLKAAGSDRWTILKQGVESAWAELESAFSKLTN